MRINRMHWARPAALAALCLTTQLLLPSPGRAEDWQVRGSGYDQRVVARYKGLLRRTPTSSYALSRLLELYRKHRSTKALLEEYRALARQHPQQLGPQLILGGLHRQLGQPAEAIEHLERAAELAPDRPDIAADLGALYQKLDLPDKARGALEKALKLSRTTTSKKRQLRALADLALQQRDGQAACQRLGQLLALEPANQKLRQELAQALAQSGQLELALTNYQALVPGTRDSAVRADLLKEIGALQAKLGQTQQAIASYNQAMSLTASGHWLRRELTDRIIAIHREQEDLDSLIARFEQQWQRRGFFEHDVLGRLYDETGAELRATRAYRAALAAAPQAVDTRVRLIALLERGGQDAEVLVEYRRLVRIAPGDPRYQLELAKRLHRSGRQQEALAVLDACSRRFPGDASVHSALADLYAGWGLQQRALASTRTLARIEPDEPAHLIALGEQVYLQGDKRRAVEIWRRLLTVIPQRPLALARLADIYGQHEMVNEAIELYQRAIKLSPETLAHRRDLALLLERNQRTSKALKAWQEVLRLARQQGQQDSKREARRHLIDILHASYQLRQQLRSYRFHFAGQTPDPEAGFLLAEAYVKLNQDEKAAEVYRRLRRLLPSELEPLAALAQIYTRQRKLQEAVALLQKMVEVHPAGARNYYQRIATLLLQLYRDDEALRYAHKAVALGPQDASSYRRLAELYERKEDYQGAMEAYTKAIELSPRDASPKLELARLLTQQGRYAEAEALYNELLAQPPQQEVIQQAFRLVIDLSGYLGHLEPLEKLLLPLSITSPWTEQYRHALIELYRRRIPALIGQARRGDPDTRLAAREQLRRIGIRGISPLLEQLASDRPTAKLVRMLGYLGNANAVLPLLRVAQDSGAEPAIVIYGEAPGTTSPYQRPALSFGKLSDRINLRVEAALAVGRIADQQAAEGLSTLLDSREGALREAAAWALAQIPSKQSERALFAALGDPRPTVQLLACTGLGLQENPKLRPALEEVMLDRQRAGAVRAGCAWGLGAMGDRRAVGSLLQALEAFGDQDLQRCATWALGQLGEPRAIPLLARLLWSRRPQLRQTYFQAVAALTAGDAALPPKPPLPAIELEGGRLDETSFLAALGASPAPLSSAALQRVRRHLLADHTAEVATGLEEALGRHRDVALRVLQDLNATTSGLSLAPLQATSEMSASTRQSLDTIGKRLLRALAALLDHRDAHVQQLALSVYSKVAPGPALATAAQRLLRSESLELRLGSLAALRRGQRRGALAAADSVAAARLALAAAHWREREAGVKLLDGLSHPATPLLLRRSLTDANAFVRQAGIAASRTLAPAGALPILAAGLRDSLPQVRLAACYLLVKRNLPALQPQLTQLAQKDPSRRVRQAAAAALHAWRR